MSKFILSCPASEAIWIIRTTLKTIVVVIDAHFFLVPVNAAFGMRMRLFDYPTTMTLASSLMDGCFESGIITCTARRK